MTLNERLTYLSEVLILLSNSPVPTQQFQTLADHAPQLVHCDYLGLAFLTPDQQSYLVHSLSGLASGAISQRPFQLDEGLIGVAIQRNRTTQIADLATLASQTADFEAVLQQFGIKTAVCVPIRQGEKPLGALFLGANSPTGYNDDDIQIARLLGAGLSAALENSRLYQELVDERRTLAAVLQSSQDAVLMLDENGFVLLANQAVAEMLHLEPDWLTGKRLADVIAYPELQQLFEARQAGLVEIKVTNGRFAQASLVPVLSEFNETIGWAAVLRDITLFKELETVKNEFVNTVSHDLKNPINTITLAAELLERVGELNPKQQDMRDRILRTGDYMNELVTDLLDLGRIEAGIGMAWLPVDLTLLVAEVMADLLPQAEEKGQALTAVLPPDPVYTTGDAARLRQLLRNLINNAIKYTPSKGNVAVSLQANDPALTLAIRDSGIGIPATDLPFIFDKFYRVHSDATKNIKGTGLGLAITQSLVEAHNGQIRVRSQVGAGTTFTVTLPQTISA
ncbi:MAG: GAF domain-containing sensor histidine kinase [Chloroflexota bacterium]